MPRHFVGNGKKTAYYPKEYFDINTIYNNLAQNDILVIKNHPFVKEKFEITSKQEEKIIDLTEYGEINELLLITDLLITDYSSTIFEYALVGKPIIFYAPDLEEYMKTRDFYCKFEEYTYGDICKTQEELIGSIKNTHLDEERLDKFKKKYLNMCDGNSTKRFVENVIKENKIGGKNSEESIISHTHVL